jgi:hypothetical protein
VSRIEWTRLAGDDVEAVVAMFVNRDRPNSLRITPSRGDGGVDILDRAGASDGRDSVHQVKRYASPLGKKEKGEIAKSLDRLFKDPRWKQLDVSEWYLETPWDPTPEALKWLREQGKKHGLAVHWHGLTWVEQQAAKYPDVVDYYLHGGVGRVQEAYAAVMGFKALEKTDEKLEVHAVVERIQAALPVLDTDPLYRYELRFGEGDFPEGHTRPGLVMTQVIGSAVGGKWAAIDLIARCAASTQIRPVTISGTFVAKAGSEFEEDLRGFLDFGAPFTSPIGAYNGEIDAPGGLGGKIVDALVRTLPAGDDLGDNPDLLVEIVNPDGEVVASADITRIERSDGRKGRRVVFEEANGAFSLEERASLEERTAIRTLSLGAVAGRPVQVALRAIDFLLACVSPNVARISVRHTPPELGASDPSWNFLDGDPDLTSTLTRERRAVSALVEIQRQLSRPIAVPDLTETPVEHVNEWLFIERLLSVGEVRMTYPEGQQVVLQVGVTAELPDGPFGVNIPIGVTVAGTRFELGKAEVWLEAPTIRSREERDDFAYFGITTPDRSYLYRYPPRPA